jgi:hypothetical protein
MIRHKLADLCKCGSFGFPVGHSVSKTIEKISREYLENMLENAWVRETNERISREYLENILESA